METLDMKGATQYLQLCKTIVGRKARAGEIPAARLGRKWVFLKADLEAYIVSQYANQRFLRVNQPQKEASAWQSTKTKKASITSTSTTQTEKELDNLLVLITKKKPKNCMTN